MGCSPGRICRPNSAAFLRKNAVFLRRRSGSSFGDEGGVADGGGVDGDLRRPGGQQVLDVGHAPDPAADGQRQVRLRHRPADSVQQGLALLDRGGDVQQHQFVGAGLAVGGGRLGRVAHLLEVHEMHALDQAAALDVQARNDTAVIH